MAMAAVMLAAKAGRAPLGNRGDTAVTSPLDGAVKQPSQHHRAMR
jgi:hypothetical protein